MFARTFLSAVLFAALGGAFASSAQARDPVSPRQETEAFLKRVMGALPGDRPVNGCFKRTYDAAHLAAHPQQKIVQATLLMHVVEISEDNHVSYQFVAGFRQRGKTGLYSAYGSCGHARAAGEGPITHLRCGVDCDGGGASVELSGDDASAMVRIQEYISVEPPGARRGADDEPPERTGIKPGADDKAFRLERVAIEQCANLFPSRKEFLEYLSSK